MTETEWLACTSPDPMLEFLRGRASDRKLRLFAVACCRRLWPLLVEEASRYVVELAEEFAEKQYRPLSLESAIRDNYAFLQTINPYTATAVAVSAANAAGGEASWAAAWVTVSDARRAIHLSNNSDPFLEAKCQSKLLREIVGNPFRSPSIEPTWLYWCNRAVEGVAQAIHEERQFDDMPILADALEDAGCDNTDILDHCRQPGPHVRGCWVLDLCLGKK